MRNGIVILAVFMVGISVVDAAQWKPADGPLMTQWAKDVSPDKVWSEYPRPQMERKQWQNLNGLWDYAITAKNVEQPTQWDGKILVPFPIESALSGVMKKVTPDQRIWYRRTFTIPNTWQGQRILLHFEAVDWETTVRLNKRELGCHRGGYDAFSFDITDALRTEGVQELEVSVYDPTDTGWQLAGKQNLRPAGCSYTACSGIWQTVWIEPVPSAYVESLKMITDIDKGVLNLTVMGRMPPKPIGVKVSVLEGQKCVAVEQAIAGREITELVRNNLVDFYKATLTWFSTDIKIAIPNAILWSPDNPFLYSLKISLIDQQGQELDEVASYFGMRSISMQQDPQGFTRLLLNNQPILLFGALDQGYWPDGIYTAPTDEALRYDIEVAKQLGLNSVRKHVKSESRRWYYWADKLGLLVLQDMPTGKEGKPDTDKPVSPEASMQCELEKRNLIKQLFNHPSIIMWILFNEGWGQHDTLRHVEMARQLDSTRLINEASGFPWRGGGDVVDSHGGIPPKDPKRIGITSETGGWGVATPGHDWTGPLWTYRTYNPQTGREISGMLENLHGKLPVLNQDSKQWFTQKVANLFYRFREDHEKTGQTGTFYCQLVDVETEINGLLSYDRAMWKVEEELIRRVCKGQTLPEEILRPVVKILTRPTLWRYTLDKPEGEWYAVNYDDSTWQKGLSGFGTSTEGASVGTPWTTENIWIRRSFEVHNTSYSVPPSLLMLHDEDAEVYINGVLAARVTGFNIGYDVFEMTSESIAALRPGRNVIAVHCHQTVGGQFIDAEILGITVDNMVQ